MAPKFAEAESAYARLHEVAGDLSGGYRTVESMVYDVLRDAILDGILPPGQRLRQEILAAAIGVSRVPVRSALLQLEAQGLVEFHDRKGAVVHALTCQQVREIYDLRILLEGHALRMSMESMTPQRLERMRLLAARADSQLEKEDFVATRKQFFREMYDAEHHPLLMQHIEDLRLKVGRYLRGWSMPAGHSHTYTAMVDVLASGDIERVMDEFHFHFGAARDGILEVVADDGAAAAASPQG